MQLYNLKSAYPLMNSLYGVEIGVEDFEDLALNGWELIGNHHTRLYRYKAPTENRELKLPCNVSSIESVHIPFEDSNYRTSKSSPFDLENIYIEKYIEKATDDFRDPYYTSGKLLKYDEGNNTLYFSRDYNNVEVVYHGIFVDEEDGLPMINQKEMKAIAAYVAHVSLMKEGIIKRDKASLELSQMIQGEWLKRCNAARVPEYLSQNDMNSILDAKTRWDRKIYGKSYKPIR